MSRLFSFGGSKDKNAKEKSAKSRHQKLPENWGNNESATKEGVVFYVKYLGSTLLEDLDEGQSYGDSISSEAVKTIVHMAKAAGKKLQKMTISVSPKGIRVVNPATHMVFTELSIYRICFCTADKSHEKVFAYIARSTENETMECHAFLCPKRKVAQAVTLTVAEAFQIAKATYEKHEEEQEQRRHEVMMNAAPAETAPADVGPADAAEPSVPAEVATAILVNIADPAPEPAAGPPPPLRDAPSPPQQGFEDNFCDADLFSSFALSRSSGQSNPFKSSRFSINVEEAEIDDSVRQLMRGQQAEEINRHPSIDDLLSL